MAFVNEIDSLKRQIDDLKRKYETRKGEIQTESQGSLRPEIDKLNREKTELQGRFAAMQVEFDAKLRDLMSQRDSLQKHLNEFETRYKSERDLLIKERDTQKAHYEATIKSLQAEIAASSKNDPTREKEMQKDIQTLIAQLEASKKQNADLQAAFNVKEQGYLKEVSNLRALNQDQVKKKEAIRHELVGDISHLKKEKGDKEVVLTGEIRELRATNNQLKKQLADAERKRKDALKAQSRSDIEIDRLRNIIDRNGRVLPFQNII